MKKNFSRSKRTRFTNQTSRTMKNSFPRMHISLYVSDINETVRFYSVFFGKPAEKIKDGYAKFILDSPSLIISFIENPDRVQHNFGHLGFQVETEALMQSHLKKARSLGIVTKEEIGTACCYAIQDKFWVNDPDDIQWEIYYFHEDAEFNDPKFETTDENACCMPTTQKQEKPKVKIATIAANSCDPGSGCC